MFVALLALAITTTPTIVPVEARARILGAVVLGQLDTDTPPGASVVRRDCDDKARCAATIVDLP